MNKNGVIHRDINPNNIYIFNIGKFFRKIKLGGFSCSIFAKDNNSEPIGSIFYTAPEIIKGLPYDEKCDLWSLGITLYESLFGHLPYGYSVTPNLIKKSILYEDNIIYEKTNIKELNIMFQKLLTINNKNRISHKQFFEYLNKNDKFFKGINWFMTQE